MPSSSESLPEDRPRASRQLLCTAHAGSPEAWAALNELTYAELHQLATLFLARERSNHTLQPTALVHETWLRLFGAGTVPPDEHARFVAMAASVMRRVLVDHARRRGTQKRGGTERRIELSQELDNGEAHLSDVVAVDEALERLARLSERQARIVELRFFGGLDVAQVAAHLGLSLSTVEREWRTARAFLQAELEGSG